MSIFTPKWKSSDKLIAGNAIRKMKYGPKKKKTIIDIIETGRRDIIFDARNRGSGDDGAFGCYKIR